jgi:hypothetical protein
MQITTGQIRQAQRTVIYGPEGIGKSTLAALWPNPLFLDTEDGTSHLNVRRIRVTAWKDVLDAMATIQKQPSLCDTIVIDTADWAERLCVSHICAKAKNTSIEDFGFGKGYIYLAEEFAAMLHTLRELRDTGIHSVIVAHSTVKKLELPDQGGAYDHYELKCSRTVTPLLKEWADALLFINYKVLVSTDKDGRSRAVGGKERIIHTQHSAAFDAKNRWNLQPTIPATFESLKPHITVRATTPKTAHAPTPHPAPTQPEDDLPYDNQTPKPATTPPPATPDQNSFNGPLYDAMKQDGVTADQLTAYLRSRKYIHDSQSIDNLPKTFVDAMLAPKNWTTIKAAINNERTK